MRVLHFKNDTITIKEKNSPTVLFSYNLKQDALSADLLVCLDCKVILLLVLCSKHNATTVYLDYNSELYEPLRQFKNLEVMYSLP